MKNRERKPAGRAVKRNRYVPLYKEMLDWENIPFSVNVYVPSFEETVKELYHASKQ